MEAPLGLAYTGLLPLRGCLWEIRQGSESEVPGSWANLEEWL